MKIFKMLLILLVAQIAFVSSASAGDFGWMDNLNVMAEGDSSGFRLRLATRFHIGDAEVKAVIGNVGSASDAYMVFRLGELSHRPINEVVNIYQEHRKQGWGAMAKRLGIKPGSREFHALKRGHDMGGGAGNGSGNGSRNDRGHSSGKDKDHGKGNSKHKGKH